MGGESCIKGYYTVHWISEIDIVVFQVVVVMGWYI